MPKIFLRYVRDMPEICPRYAPWDMPEICLRYTHCNWEDIISFWGDIINLWGHIISFCGRIISFWGHVFIGGTLSFLYWSCGGKVLLGVIINNWGHNITFWGWGLIGGDYHYLGARLLATSIIGWRDTLTRCFQNPGIAEKKGLVVTHVKIFLVSLTKC